MAGLTSIDGMIRFLSKTPIVGKLFKNKGVFKYIKWIPSPVWAILRAYLIAGVTLDLLEKDLLKMKIINDESAQLESLLGGFSQLVITDESATADNTVENTENNISDNNAVTQKAFVAGNEDWAQKWLNSGQNNKSNQPAQVNTNNIINTNPQPKIQTQIQTNGPIEPPAATSTSTNKGGFFNNLLNKAVPGAGSALAKQPPKTIVKPQVLGDINKQVLAIRNSSNIINQNINIHISNYGISNVTIELFYYVGYTGDIQKLINACDDYLKNNNNIKTLRQIVSEVYNKLKGKPTDAEKHYNDVNKAIKDLREHWDIFVQIVKSQGPVVFQQIVDYISQQADQNAKNMQVRQEKNMSDKITKISESIMNDVIDDVKMAVLANKTDRESIKQLAEHVNRVMDDRIRHKGFIWLLAIGAVSAYISLILMINAYKNLLQKPALRDSQFMQNKLNEMIAKKGDKEKDLIALYNQNEQFRNSLQSQVTTGKIEFWFGVISAVAETANMIKAINSVRMSITQWLKLRGHISPKTNPEALAAEAFQMSKQQSAQETKSFFDGLVKGDNTSLAIKSKSITDANKELIEKYLSEEPQIMSNTILKDAQELEKFEHAMGIESVSNYIMNSKKGQLLVYYIKKNMTKSPFQEELSRKLCEYTAKAKKPPIIPAWATKTVGFLVDALTGTAAAALALPLAYCFLRGWVSAIKQGKGVDAHTIFSNFRIYCSELFGTLWFLIEDECMLDATFLYNAFIRQIPEDEKKKILSEYMTVKPTQTEKIITQQKPINSDKIKQQISNNQKSNAPTAENW